MSSDTSPDTTEQATLLQRGDVLQVATYVRIWENGYAKVACPDCKEFVEESKRGHRFDGDTILGWACDSCKTVLPCTTDEYATAYVDGWTGKKIRFRDGEWRFVPVREGGGRA